MKILAFSGSNSSVSINQKLIDLSSQFLNTPYEIIDLRAFQIPMFSEDEERENSFSKDLTLLYHRLISYDAYIISVPEHNRNFPAFFKNILDWLSRIDRKFFSGKPILIFNATPGLYSGGYVLNLAEEAFRYFGGHVIGSLSIKKFDPKSKGGKFVHEDEKEIRKAIDKFEKSLFRIEKNK